MLVCGHVVAAVVASGAKRERRLRRLRREVALAWPLMPRMLA